MHNLLLSLALLSGPQAADAPAGVPIEVPRLIVFLSIDQLIPEQMERLEGHFTGGLARLRQEGAYLTDAALPYSASETGPGHATMGTGCLPKTHGIVGNVLYLREDGGSLYCVGDADARDVTPLGIDLEKGSKSARNLLRPTLGDHLKRANPASKVFTISGKDRSAICLAGLTGDLALWWEYKYGFCSSDAYVQALPEYVLAFNKAWPAEAVGLVWEPSFAPENTPPQTAADDRGGEGHFPGGGHVFPHKFTGERGEILEGEALETLAKQVKYSPWGDRYTMRMAKAMLEREGLGLDDAPDLLGISLSGPDLVGHSFGPYSVEVTDCLLHLDRDLGGLFAAIDDAVGKDRWVLAMTADHGVMPLPESDSKLHGISGMRRVTKEQVKEANGHVAEALKEAFGEDNRGRGLRPIFRGGNLYFDRVDLARRKVFATQARKVAGESLLELDWVARVYPLEELAGLEPTGDSILASFRLAHRDRYSPDVTILQKRGILVGWDTGTTHGSPYDYDRRIPVYFWGKPFEQGAIAGEAGSQDMVPTLLKLLGLSVGGLDGKVLEKVLR